MAADREQLLETARNPEQDLSARIAALRGLGDMADAALAPRLRELRNRPRPSIPAALDWDQAAAERVVDLHVILALHRCRDASGLAGIAPLVAQAGYVLKGPLGELRNAAAVIRQVGSLEPLRQVVALADPSKPETAAKAVRVLQMLDLPDPPTGGPLSQLRKLTTPVTFTALRLSDELATIVGLSDGTIVLSPGVAETLRTRDFDRGVVARSDTTIESILTQELDALDLTYAVTAGGVSICTFSEAGARWQQAWAEYSKRLAQQGWKP